MLSPQCQRWLHAPPYGMGPGHICPWAESGTGKGWAKPSCVALAPLHGNLHTHAEHGFTGVHICALVCPRTFISTTSVVHVPLAHLHGRTSERTLLNVPVFWVSAGRTQTRQCRFARAWTLHTQVHMACVLTHLHAHLCAQAGAPAGGLCVHSRKHMGESVAMCALTCVGTLVCSHSHIFTVTCTCSPVRTPWDVCAEAQMWGHACNTHTAAAPRLPCNGARKPSLAPSGDLPA